MEDFVFNEQVVRVFPDMIQRSVPGYATLVEMIGQLAGEFLRPDTRCYDLGCSLGAVSFALAGAAVAAGVEILAVDNAPAMIERLDERLARLLPAPPVRTLCADIQAVEIRDASLVVLNLTLQFLPLEQRLALLRRIVDGLLPGGVLILSEKVALETTPAQDRMDALHRAFKRAQGYSDLEISQKRAALKRVLVPETLARHRERLRQAGFASSDVWFQCLNFVSFVCRK